MQKHKIACGIEVYTKEFSQQFSGLKLALLANQASVNEELNYTWDILNYLHPGQLKVLFSPQHGLWGEQQANMIETPHTIHKNLNIPVYSLYADTRWPTEEMLIKIDALIVDLQDVGTRVYTFIWTVMYCLEACAKYNKKIIILDRPNPLGGINFEGPLLDENYFSFVGRASIPMRHGLTIGELALLINKEFNIGADLKIIPMRGWKRDFLFGDLDRSWIPTSPNLPQLDSVYNYPGQVLLEGTNLSEGRGTTFPFECIGAPFIDPFELHDAIKKFDLPGIKFLPIRFLPTFDKWKGTSCGGLYFKITDPRIYQSYKTTIALLTCINNLWKNSFQFIDPPYEYEKEKSPIDILSGNSTLRSLMEMSEVLESQAINPITELPKPKWMSRISNILLYES